MSQIDQSVDYTKRIGEVAGAARSVRDFKARAAVPACAFLAAILPVASVGNIIGIWDPLPLESFTSFPFLIWAFVAVSACALVMPGIGAAARHVRTADMATGAVAAILAATIAFSLLELLQSVYQMLSLTRGATFGFGLLPSFGAPFAAAALFLAIRRGVKALKAPLHA